MQLTERSTWMEQTSVELAEFVLVITRATRRLPRHLGEMYRRQAGRQALAALDDRLLRDIGITRDQALQEAAKAPWRV